MIARIRHLAAVSVLASMTLASCGILGDKGLPIEFVNVTDQHLVLWQRGRPHPSYRRELPAQGRVRDVWVDPRIDDYAKDLVKFRVEATSDAGDLVFCHVFTWNDFTRLGWIVEIRRQNDCPP